MEKAGGKKKKKSKKTQDVEEDSEVVVAVPEEDLMKDSTVSLEPLLCEDISVNVKSYSSMTSHLYQCEVIFIDDKSSLSM